MKDASLNLTGTKSAWVTRLIVQVSASVIYGKWKITQKLFYVDDLIDSLINSMNSRDGFAGSINIGNFNCEVKPLFHEMT